MQEFTNKKVAVLGFGVEGKSVVDFLLKEKAKVSVFVEKSDGLSSFAKATADKEGLEGVEVNIGLFPDLSSFDVIVRSPGIRPDIPVLKGKVITSSTIIFFERCPCPIIGITGTKGKGTTSTLIYEMLKQDRKIDRKKDRKIEENETVFLGGNIGIPPLSFLSKLTKDCVVVLELSSFQLMDCPYSPHIAVFLMTVSEHQDWHTSLDEYVEAKFGIIKNQKSNDTAIINIDYPLNRNLVGRVPGKLLSVSTMPHDHPGVFVTDRNVFIYQTQTKKQRIFTADNLLLPGKHNLENVGAAIAAAKTFGVKIASIQHVLETFEGLPHRLEKVAIVNTITYYNDSFATTPETTIAAIHAFDAPKVLILGGSSKHANFSELGKAITTSSSIRGIIGIGVEWERIKKEIRNQKKEIRIIEGCKNMKEIVEKAKEMAQPGDVVLLSPACASFGMFQNYKERGNQFREEVRKLEKLLPVSTLNVEEK